MPCYAPQIHIVEKKFPPQSQTCDEQGWSKGAITSIPVRTSLYQGSAVQLASCHSVEGQGDGTFSRSLTVKPTDYTQLQKKNQRVFPLEKVIASIDGKTIIAAHGESKVPVRGEIFEKAAPAGASTAKVKAIVEYLPTIQR